MWCDVMNCRMWIDTLSFLIGCNLEEGMIYLQGGNELLIYLPGRNQLFARQESIIFQAGMIYLPAGNDSFDRQEWIICQVGIIYL